MEPDELSQPLIFLKEEIDAQKTDTDLIGWIEAVLSNSPGIIDQLKQKLDQSSTGFFREIEKMPYYDLLLAYAYYRYHKIDQAIFHIQQAETGFRNEEDRHSQAIASSWFLGLLLSQQGRALETERKMKEIEERISIWGKKLFNDHPGDHKYQIINEKIKKSYRAVTERFEAQSRPTQPHPESGKKPETQSGWMPNYFIYGTGTAGPQGEAYFQPTNETVQASQAARIVIIRDKEYKVASTHAEGHLHLGAQSTFGWLKVVGESMNAAPQTPINHCCYVLFQENRNPYSCLRKIVVAELPDNLTQPPQLVVKRLIQIGENFFLHSESSFEKDPLTGKSYQEDLEIVRNNQVRAVVIAVATPVKCTLGGSCSPIS